MKTAELSGVALDWAVTFAEYHDSETVWRNFRDDCHYSTDWAQGGPIIEREGISLECSNGDWFAKYETSAIQYFSYSPLLSAMRCYVASKLGDEVEIPAELTEAA